MSKLNKDILFLLFEELQDDSKSLFSCLLVNRLWCETIVPILWRNPWRYDIKYQNKSSLSNIVTLSLSDDIKEILISQGVQFTSTITQKPLLFDYLSFCRSMNINAINDIISVGTSSSDYHQFLLQKEIYNLFMKKCPELKNLDIRSIEHQLFYIPESNARFNSLCELICDINSDYTYFYGLACICNSIEKLIIVSGVYNGNDGIIKLIEVQTNLKYFEWQENYFDVENFSDVFYKKLSQALVKQADTLTHFIISAIDDYFVSSEILTKLHKLRTIKLNFNEIEGTYEEKLANSVYSNLEILQLDNFVFINTVTCLIKNSEGHLREILINNYYYNNNSDGYYKQSLFLICAIYEKCPLVEYLSLAFPLSKEHFIEFEKLLKACQKLRVLLLHMDDFVNDTNGEEFLKVLSKSAPINLREIRFSEYFKISLEPLEEFLANWKVKRRPALTILTIDHDYEKEEYMELINRYKNYGILKDFRCVSTRSEMYFSKFIQQFTV